jgi:hypothetical protein
MTESLCLATMGQLIDTAISHICTDILALVDITAEESERLKELCSILRPIEDRFNDMNVSPGIPFSKTTDPASGKHCRLCTALAALLLSLRNHGK